MASDARYLVVRNGTADGDPVCSLSPDELRATRLEVLDMAKEPAHV